MGPFGPVSPIREVEATLASFQWSNKPSKFEDAGRCFFETFLGTINVIFAAPGRTGSYPSRVMSVSRSSAEEYSSMSKRAKMDIPLVLGFSDEDKVGTIQPHDDALVVTLRMVGTMSKG